MDRFNINDENRDDPEWLLGEQIHDMFAIDIEKAVAVREMGIGRLEGGDEDNPWGYAYGVTLYGSRAVDFENDKWEDAEVQIILNSHTMAQMLKGFLGAMVENCDTSAVTALLVRLVETPEQSLKRVTGDGEE